MSKDSNAIGQNREGRARPSREEMERLLEYRGPLVIPPSLKKEGYVYKWLKDKTLVLEQYLALGFDYTRDADGKPHSVGNARESVYLVEIPEEYYKDIEQIVLEKRLARTKEIGGVKQKDPNAPGGVFDIDMQIQNDFSL